MVLYVLGCCFDRAPASESQRLYPPYLLCPSQRSRILLRMDKALPHQQLTLWEIWLDTFRSLGGWKGLGILTLGCYVFVLAIHFAIPLRHGHIRRLKNAAAYRKGLGKFAAPSAAGKKLQ